VFVSLVLGLFIASIISEVQNEKKRYLLCWDFIEMDNLQKKRS